MLWLDIINCIVESKGISNKGLLFGSCDPAMVQVIWVKLQLEQYSSSPVHQGLNSSQVALCLCVTGMSQEGIGCLALLLFTIRQEHINDISFGM